MLGPSSRRGVNPGILENRFSKDGQFAYCGHPHGSFMIGLCCLLWGAGPQVVVLCAQLREGS